jgi:hypothetical protein
MMRYVGYVAIAAAGNGRAVNVVNVVEIDRK